MNLDRKKMDVLQELDEILGSMGVKYVLIGALIPEILIDMKEEDGKGYGIRTTNDIDITVKIRDWQEFHQLKERLIAEGLQERTGESEHRLFLKGIPIDIVPYSKRILKNGKLVWPGNGHEMEMSGFDLLFQNAEQIKLSDSLSINVIPLPLSIYIKIMSFLERNAVKDLADIIYMLAHYEESTVSERRTDPEIPLDMPYKNRGAFLLGMDLKKYSIEGKIKPFIDNINSIFIIPLRQAFRIANQNEEDGFQLLEAFKEGMSGNI